MVNIPRTSVTLLNALSANRESARWYEFYDRYQPVMAAYLKKAFPSVEPDDVIAETMIVLMKKLPGYRYLPDEKGLFRNYLTGIVKFKAVEVLRRRKREEDKRARLDAETSERGQTPVADEDEERVWRRAAYEVALQQLLADATIKEQTRQIFLRVAVDGESPESVAGAFGVTRNNVDQIKNRMTARLRTLVQKLLERTDA